MLKRILVALTGTPGGITAVRHTVELAQRHGGKLTGVTLFDPRKIKNVGSVPIGAGAAAKELKAHRMKVIREEMDKAIADFRSTCESKGVVHRVVVEEGNPCKQLLEMSRYHDLVAFGVRGLLGFGHPRKSQGLFGPLVSVGVRPLLAVAPEYRPIRRVMIAYSGSRESAKTIRRFAQIDAWPDVAVDIVTFGPRAEPAKQLLDDAAEYCTDHGFEVQTSHSTDKPREGILNYAAQHDIDLIVMGYSVRSKFKKIMMGQTGLHVLRNTERSVFLSQ